MSEKPKCDRVIGNSYSAARRCRLNAKVKVVHRDTRRAYYRCHMHVGEFSSTFYEFERLNAARDEGMR